jgi:hypothetical protein
MMKKVGRKWSGKEEQKRISGDIYTAIHFLWGFLAFVAHILDTMWTSAVHAFGLIHTNQIQVPVLTRHIKLGMLTVKPQGVQTRV